MYKNILNKALNICAGIGVLAGKVANDALMNQGNVPNFVTIIGLLTAFFMSTTITYSLFRFIVSRWQGLRRFILGSNFVEGVWLEVVENDEGYKGIALTRLVFDNFNLSFSGTDYGRSGIAVANYRGDILDTSYPTLTYKHSTQPLKDSLYIGSDPNHISKKSRLEGFGEMQFHPRPSGLPLAYTGFFIHQNIGIRYTVSGRKIQDNKILSNLDDSILLEKFIQSEVQKSTKDSKQ